METQNSREFFNSSYELIEQVIRLRCFRCRQIGMDADEFRSYALLKLIDNDFRILRRYRKRSSLKTYLTTVIHRLFLDFRIHCWGKWRPSATASEMGPMAIDLERLLTRDEFTLAEASEWIRADYPGVTEATIDEMARRIPFRQPRRFEGEETLARLTDSTPAEKNWSAGALPRSLTAALQMAWNTLSDEDREILRLRYREGLTVARIARRLELEQKPLYRRIERLLRDVRRRLEHEGVSAKEVRKWLS